MDRRPKKNRPSNVITYVLVSIAALFGLFIMGQVLQSLDRESVAPGPEKLIGSAGIDRKNDVL